MKYAYFTPSNFKDFVDTCLKVFELGEPGVFLSIKTATPEVRVDQLIQEYKSFKIIKIQAGVNLDTGDDVAFFLRKQKIRHSEKVGVFISHAEIPVREGNFRLFDDILHLRQNYPHIRFIFLSEIDFTHPTIAPKFTNSRIFSSIHYYPLYSSEDMIHFAEHMAKEWKMKIDKKLAKAICEYCGGYMWLVKEAVRSVKFQNYSDIKEISQTDTMRIKLEQIYISFLESEKKVLTRIVKKEKPETNTDEKHSYHYLSKIGLIANNKITVPALDYYIREHLPTVDIRVQDNHLTVNGVVIDSGFSRKQQRVLRYLLMHAGTIVPRDEVAKAIWPINTDDYYTDWALDRIIARLRENVIRIGLHKNVIQTVRGQGYKIDLTQRS